jgi:UDP:flavonoid glycosyltransferase YjiC (YdhE family)
MSEIVAHQLADEVSVLRAEIERLREALKRLLNDSMYKDHPEASQMAIDALGGVDAALYEPQGPGL